MPSPTLTDYNLSTNKNYSDTAVWGETAADTFFASIETYVNDTLKDNLQQLARDCFGTDDYQFDSDGLAQYTNNLFNKQYVTDFYNGGNISIGTVADTSWVAVDAVNAAVTITPEKVGQYRVTVYFVHRASTVATTEGSIDVGFRITDGTDASYSVNSGGYMPATAASSGSWYNSHTISYIFDWSTTTAKTITLQKYVRTATNITSNVVSAAAATGEIYLEVHKI